MAEPARATPWDRVFAGERFEHDVMPAIAAEAAAVGADLTDPDAFALLGTVGALLRELLVERDSPTTVRPLALLLFQAFQFWRFGKHTYTLGTSQLDQLLANDAGHPAWPLTSPRPAGYAQLPRHRVWSRIDARAPAEPVDGFFWTLIGREDPATPPFHRLDVLLALGLHAERAGLSVIEASSLVPAGPPGHWADVPAREQGDDFSNVLPGGELSGLYALTNVAEALKLVCRFFRFMSGLRSGNG